MDKLQSVLNAATRAIAGTRKFDSVWVRYCTMNFAGMTFLADIFSARSNSLPMSERSRTTVLVGALHPCFRCLHSVADLRSANHPPSSCSTAIPAQHLNTYGRRAFSVAGPTV